MSEGSRACLGLRQHAAYLAFGTAVWAVFWVLGLPGYYQQYPAAWVGAGLVLSLAPMLWVTVKVMFKVIPDEPVRAALLMAFYTTGPLFVYDYLYCGVYLGHGIGFLKTYWYLTVYYVIPWVALPPVGYYWRRLSERNVG